MNTGASAVFASKRRWRFALAGFMCLILAITIMLISRFAGTCTGGSADEQFAVVSSLPFYAFGMILFWLSGIRGRFLLLFLLFVWPAYVQLDFAIKLLHGYIWSGRSVCDIKQNWATDPNSHAYVEPSLVALWLVANVITLGGVAALILAPRR